MPPSRIRMHASNGPRLLLALPSAVSRREGGRKWSSCSLLWLRFSSRLNSFSVFRHHYPLPFPSLSLLNPPSTPSPVTYSPSSPILTFTVPIPYPILFFRSILHSPLSYPCLHHFFTLLFHPPLSLTSAPSPNSSFHPHPRPRPITPLIPLPPTLTHAPHTLTLTHTPPPQHPLPSLPHPHLLLPSLTPLPTHPPLHQHLHPLIRTTLFLISPHPHSLPFHHPLPLPQSPHSPSHLPSPPLPPPSPHLTPSSFLLTLTTQNSLSHISSFLPLLLSFSFFLPLFFFLISPLLSPSHSVLCHPLLFRLFLLPLLPLLLFSLPFPISLTYPHPSFFFSSLYLLLNSLLFPSPFSLPSSLQPSWTLPLLHPISTQSSLSFLSLFHPFLPHPFPPSLPLQNFSFPSYSISTSPSLSILSGPDPFPHRFPPLPLHFSLLLNHLLLLSLPPHSPPTPPSFSSLSSPQASPVPFAPSPLPSLPSPLTLLLSPSPFPPTFLLSTLPPTSFPLLPPASDSLSLPPTLLLSPPPSHPSPSPNPRSLSPHPSPPPLPIHQESSYPHGVCADGRSKIRRFAFKSFLSQRNGARR
ncbi:hypothetical protein C7M84_004426 [Penaeus vannamei]|uniref:Uncharacterized protein n=1 Tax=Penaeus vannamei TaxID=6689 RepID=A0A423TKK5_PENVA|nr:hypothetical protein C7M84_004426 [Penaeus vannamei]